jgi:hypothetical protein
MADYKWDNAGVKMTSMKKIILAASMFLVAISFTTSDVFASHSSEELKWQLVYITSNNACSNYDLQMLRTYSEVSKLYLDKYELENSPYESLCVTDDKYTGYEAPIDLDLVILVYDKDLGRAELNSENIGGYYHHVGRDPVQNHAIVVCNCPTFEFSSPIWILTHELSHFVLTYLSYDMTVIEDLVHSNDAAYDECIRTHSSCDSNVMKIRTETSAYSYSVMPLYEPAIGLKPFPSQDEQLPIQVVELSKIITKWWTEDKITDGDLFNAIGFMAAGNSLYTHMNSEIFTADSSFDDDVTWEDLLSEKLPSEKSDILSRIPESLMSIEESSFDEGETSGIPTWFKTTAKWWIEGKISDSEFQKSVNYLRDEGILRAR